MIVVEFFTTTWLKLRRVNDAVDRAVGGARVLNVLQIFIIYQTASFIVDFLGHSAAQRGLNYFLQLHVSTREVTTFQSDIMSLYDLLFLIFTF